MMVWKALSYINRDDEAWSMPVLHRDRIVARGEDGTTKMLTQAFFPIQPEPETRPSNAATNVDDNGDDLIQSLISEEEVRKAIFSSNPRKAPGPDGLPFRVWQGFF
jgi:hypothetical protein